ncbi:MAG: hypothetical protein CL920_36250 [Deltaproteobacteria bacterium]|nr:hypothetical protein [Deltaproteobacteria bacterium]
MKPYRKAICTYSIYIMLCVWGGLTGGLGCTQAPEAIEPIRETVGNQVFFRASWDTSSTFYHFPFPSDLRLTSTGGLDIEGFPNDAENKLVANLLGILHEHKGAPLAPIAYFQFQRPLAPRDAKKPVLPAKDAPVMLIDIDPSSPLRGTMYPVVATELPLDDYIPAPLLAVGVYPGVILWQQRTYAFVVMRSYKDAEGKDLGVPKVINQLKAGVTPEGTWGATLQKTYTPLWETLKKEGISVDDVAAATVFTTGAVVSENERISSAMKKVYKPDIEELTLVSGTHERFCELKGSMAVPIFQQGTPPYETEGMFEMDKDGLPIKQRDKMIPVTITLPKKPMPEGGYPLMMYIHGSGGRANQVVHRGPRVPSDDPRARGHGPSHVVAPFGLATASMAMPLNPERVPGANALAYFNLCNMKIFRDTYRQGLIEVRLFLDALLRLKISPDVRKACKGPSLPPGASAYTFSAKRLTLMGQSMGGTYSNLVAAVEPRFQAVVPTGTGGYWGYFAYRNNVSLLSQSIVSGMMGLDNEMTHLHPIMNVLEIAWEPADPFISSAYLARRTLKPDFPVRSIYEPVGLQDSFFTTTILDLMASGYGNQQAGDTVWPGMQERFKVLGLDKKASYPIKQNRKGAGGVEYTGVVVQYSPDTQTKNGHIIAFQLDDVKYQYGCFLSTFIRTGVGVVPAPAALGTPCPQ